MNRCIVVLGMHRSGTSAVMGALGIHGVNLGSRLIADLYEHEFSVNQNTLLLSDLGSAWDDIFRLPENWWKGTVAGEYRQRIIEQLHREFGNSDLWGLKDPRMCITLPLWLEVFDRLETQPYFVISLRHPFEVCRSHSRRDGFSQEKALLLWMNYLLSAERFTRNHARCFLKFSELIADPIESLSGLQAKLNIPLPRCGHETDKDLLSFINPGLKHHTVNSNRLVADAPSFVAELWNWLDRLCTCDAKDPQTINAIDAVGMQFHRLNSFFLNSQLKSDVECSRQNGIAAMNVINKIGQDYLTTGRFGEAVGFFSALVAHFPEDLRLINNLGIAHEHNGDLDTAAECFQHALTIEPMYFMAQQNLMRLKSA